MDMEEALGKIAASHGAATRYQDCRHLLHEVNFASSPYKAVTGKANYGNYRQFHCGEYIYADTAPNDLSASG